MTDKISPYKQRWESDIPKQQSAVHQHSTAYDVEMIQKKLSSS
jgi:hypothetical protein